MIAPKERNCRRFSAASNIQQREDNPSESRLFVKRSLVLDNVFNKSKMAWQYRGLDYWEDGLDYWENNKRAGYSITNWPEKSRSTSRTVAREWNFLELGERHTLASPLIDCPAIKYLAFSTCVRNWHTYCHLYLRATFNRTNFSNDRKFFILRMG